MGKMLNPKNDVVFQKIFGSEENKGLLISFLNSILVRAGNSEITNLTIEKKILDVTMIVDEKLSILDVHITTEDKVIVNVEIQLINQYNMIKRTLFYWSKMYLKQLKKGQVYSELHKTITINILDFDYIKCEKFHSWYHLYENDTRYKLTDMMEIHFIELNKFNKADKEYRDELHRWLKFLQNPESEEVKEIMGYDDRIREAMEVLEYISGDEEIVRLAEMREKALRDEESRLSGARAEGEKKGEINIAKEMLRDNEPIEKIMKYTKLNKKELEELKAELS